MKVSDLPTLEDIFKKSGFVHIQSEGIHFDVAGKRGELDHIFVWENLVVLCEVTSDKKPANHLPKKMIFHNKIKENLGFFFENYCEKDDTLERVLGKYGWRDMEVRHIYYSKNPIRDQEVSDPFFILKPSEAKYFHSLAKTIQGSAKYEILKYLRVDMKCIGESRIAGREVDIEQFQGFLIPANHTNYPDGFSIVSFYADPKSLISRASILRRDGWREQGLSYQRFIKEDKLISMRKQLSEKGKVYLNNIVVTLPSEALIRDENDKDIDCESVDQPRSVILHLPKELGTVGIIDGQHRLFSYYEGCGEENGDIERKIDNLRSRKNLLVTGIVFPKNYQGSKESFEAELFISINSNQSPVDASLMQEVKMLIDPNSPETLARRLINEISLGKALKGRLKTSQLDEKNVDLIAVGSLAPYVAQSIFGKRSSLAKEWSRETGKIRSEENNKDLVKYMADELDALLFSAKRILEDGWQTKEQGGVLSTTVIGGFIRLFVRMSKDIPKTERKYDELFKRCKLEKFKFSSYTGSAWGKMANDLYKEIKNPTKKLK